MAIITQELEGNRVRTYSSLGMKIEREGARYDEAIDPKNFGRVYTETDEPIEGYEAMKYSTLSIKRELAKIGKWDITKELLNTAGYWDDYVLANYLSETDEVFKTACAALVARGIVTESELNALLPRCVWVAE